MRKYIMNFLSFTFLIMILLIPSQKVDADELETKTYDYNNSEVVNGYYEKFKVQMEEVKTYLDNYKNDYYYIIYFQSTSVRVYLYEKTDNFRFIFRLDDTVYGFNYGPTNNFKIKKLDFGFDLGNFETNFNTFKNKLENNNFDETYNGGSSSSTYKDGLTRDTTARIYYTNYDNFILSEDSIYNLNINGDILIKPGEKVPTYYEVINKSNNSFNEIIPTGTYSKVEFDFVLPNSTSICTKTEYIDGVITEVEYVCPLLDLNYNIYASDLNGNISISTFTIPYIYKRYLVDSGNMSITKVDTIPLGDNMYNQYQGNYYIEYDSDMVEKVKLVLDLTGYEFSYVNVQFDSNIAYNVTYYERATEHEHIGSVDLTGKAGVMFIPKQITDDMLLNFSFYPGLYSIQLRDTYKSDYNILKYYSVGYCDDRDYNDNIPFICNNGGSYNISVEFKKGNLEQSLFIVNRNYPNKDYALVYYDTRYFDYVVYNTMADSPTFNHPITGDEDFSNSLIDFDSAMTNQEDFFSSIVKALNHFKGIIVEIFSNISYFFNNLNFVLKYFFIAIFALIIFIFLTRFLL